MPAGLPELTVNVRHYFLVHSVWGHPWQTATESSPVPWYSGMSAEEVIGLLHSDAAVIWAKAGTRLVNAGCEPVFDDFWYRWETLSGTLKESQRLDFAASLRHQGTWQKNRTYCAVFWVKTMGVYDLGVASFGAYRFVPQFRSDEFFWTDPVVVVMSSATGTLLVRTNGNPCRSAGLTLAHELGHLLGLSHPWDAPSASLKPFENDLSQMGTHAGDRNLMSYFFFAKFTSTVPAAGLQAEEILITNAQMHRARLTLLQRTSPYVVDQPYEVVRLNPNYADRSNRAFAQDGLNEVEDLPDWLSSYHASWMT